MKSIQKFFNTSEWDLINLVLETGRKSENGTTIKWITLAKKFNIKPEGNSKQRRTASNDIWRRFLKHIQKHNLDLVTVKQTLNGSGEVLFETRKVLPEVQNYSTEGLIIDKVTTNPHGGEWITYKKPNSYLENKDILEPTFDKLFEKYQNFSFENEDFTFRKALIGEDTESYFGIKVGPRIAVLNLYDAHLDKLPIKSTCGVETTLEDNLNVFRNTIDKIIPHIIANQVERIIFPVGNDLFHTNGFNSQTKKGTQIEYYGSPEDAYYAICDVISETILKLSRVADVEVIMIKGNHDEDKVTTLGFWLNRMFYNTNVSVDFLRRQRKYIQYGENLLGFAHGDKEKSKIAQLPLIMAQEAKTMWGNTTYRKMFLGDLHHGFEYQFLKAKDMPGVEVEYLRSVGTTDTWHEDFGWVGVPKTAYLQIIDKEDGECSRMKFPIK